MAAAPDMREAIEKFMSRYLDYPSRPPDMNPAFDKLLAALAKANGETA